MALYNNGFPMTYQPVYPQYQYQTPAQPSNQQQTMQSNLIWVQGEAGAKAYIVAPNTTIQLWDSDAQVIYLKSADASGMPSLKILDYTIRDQKHGALPKEPVKQDLSNYVTKDEFDAMVAKYDSLKAELDGLVQRKQPRTRREADLDE